MLINLSSSAAVNEKFKDWKIGGVNNREKAREVYCPQDY